MPKLKSLQYTKRFLPWLVTIGIFIYLFCEIPLTKVFEASAGVNLWLFIPVIFFGFSLYLLWDVLVFTFLFREIREPVPYRGMFTVRAASYLLSIVNYFIGVGSVALLMNRWRKIPISRTGSVVFFKIFMEYYAIMAVCLLTVFLIPGIDLDTSLEFSKEGDLVRFILIAWIFFVLIHMFFHLFLPRVNGFKRIKKNIFLSTIRDFPPTKQIVFILMQVIGFFFFDVVVAYIAFTVFGLKTPLILFIALFPIVRLFEALPISVMGLGTSQMAMIWIFAPIVENPGSDSTVTASLLAFSLLISIFTNLSRFTIGAVSVRFLPPNVWNKEIP